MWIRLVKHLLLGILDFSYVGKKCIIESKSILQGNIVSLSSKITYHFVRRLIGFVIGCGTVKQQKHRKQRQQGHHRDFV